MSPHSQKRQKSADGVALPFDYVVWQLIRVSRRFRKMRDQHFADFLNRLDQRVAEFLVLKMGPHSFDNALPKLVATFLVKGSIANNGELVLAWRHENQNRIVLRGLVHLEVLKFFLCNNQGISFQFTALNINTNLARSF